MNTCSMVKKTQNSDLRQTITALDKNDVLEVDEMWSFVESKKNPKWLWLAISRNTRHIVAFHLGSRTDIDCLRFYRKIPKEYKKLKDYSDKWETYKNVFPYDQLRHECVNKDSGQTNHIERFNLTVRQRLARYVRKILSFSKKEYWRNLVTKLFIIEHDQSLAFS